MALVASQAALAQGAAGVPGPVQQAQPTPQPEALAPVPDIRIERSGSVADAGPGAPPFVARSLHVSGATRFPEATLIAVSGFRPGQSVTVGDLRRMAGLISSFYNAHGYPVAQAYIPAQSPADGAVTIAVIEGHYGAVRLNNHSRLRNGEARAILAGLNSGDVVASAPLERRLLLLSDTPGVRATSTLAPGAQVGTSDLTVDLANSHLVSGELDVDNDGDPYTGRWRGGGTLNLNDPLGLGDQASVRFVTSGSGYDYLRASYQAQAGLVTIGGAYTDFRYELGRQYAGFDQHGTEQIGSLYASYPLVRTERDSVRLLGDVDYRALHNDDGTPGADYNRDAWVGSATLLGRHRDGLGGGGSDNWSLGVSVGNLDVRGAYALTQDAASARTEGGYVVVRGSVDRLQNLGGPFQLYGWVRGQWASKNLDIDEKMELGGAWGVRAYPEGEAYGDEGYLATAELRAWLPRFSRDFPGRFQLAVFEDVGQVRYAVNPWLPGSDQATRAGAGVSLAWTQENGFLVRVSYAHRTGTPPATSYRQADGVVRFEAVKFF